MTLKSIVEDFLYGILFVVFVIMLSLTELYWTIFPSRAPDRDFYEWFMVGEK